jgi:hypothetical protein
MCLHAFHLLKVCCIAYITSNILVDFDNLILQYDSYITLALLLSHRHPTLP